jgi:hypothetical protein
MKKSILMAIVALALLAAPAFAGEFGHKIVLDAGFGIGFNEDLKQYSAITDGGATFGVTGTLDDNNSVYLGFDMGGLDLSGGDYRSGTTGNVMDAGPDDIAGNADDVNVGGVSYGQGPLSTIDDFSATTNVLGAFGVTDVPVTLTMNYGYGRLNLHNRFNQWTGWEYTVRKGIAAPAGWGRELKVSFTANIMSLVNVMIGFHPDFNQNNSGANVVLDVWTSVPAGPVNLDISAYILNNAGAHTIYGGGEVQGNMVLGPVSLMVALVDTMTIAGGNTDLVNDLMIAAKPTMTVGPATLGLGVWMNANTDTGLDEDATTMSMAIDLSATVAMITLFGGIELAQLNNLPDGVEIMDGSVVEVGAKVNFGAVTLTMGVNGGKADSIAAGAADMNAADGTTGGTEMMLYTRIQAAMW